MSDPKVVEWCIMKAGRIVDVLLLEEGSTPIVPEGCTARRFDYLTPNYQRCAVDGA